MAPSVFAAGSFIPHFLIFQSTYGQVCTMKGHGKTVTSVAFSPDDKCVVSGSFDLTVRIWDAVTGREVGIWRYAGSCVALC